MSAYFILLFILDFYKPFFSIIRYYKGVVDSFDTNSKRHKVCTLFYLPLRGGYLICLKN
jgi:hypothetical protein